MSLYFSQSNPSYFDKVMAKSFSKNKISQSYNVSYDGTYSFLPNIDPIVGFENLTAENSPKI